MMKFFDNLRMGTKLVGGFGVVLLLFACVMGLYQVTVKSTAQNFQNLMRVHVSMANQASEIQTLMKQCRIAEKDFLATLDRKYLADIEHAIKELSSKSHEMMDKARAADDRTSIQRGEEIVRLMDSYAQRFQELSAAYEIRGLDASSGLRGVFAEASQRLGVEMSYVDVEDLYLYMLRIVQMQNRYSMEKDTEILGELDTLVKMYPDILTQSAANEGMVKDLMGEMMGLYAEALAALKAAPSPQEKSVHLGEMEEAIAELDGVFSTCFLPNVKPYLLEIWNREKNYLLHRGPQEAEQVRESMTVLFKRIEGSRIIEDYKKHVTRYLEAYRGAFEALVAEDMRIEVLYGGMLEAVNLAEPLIHTLFMEARSQANQGSLRVDQDAEKRSRLALFIGIAAMITGFSLSLFITRKITVPIARAAAFSRKMARGDFTSRLDIEQKDEIGLLAEALNGMVKGLGDVIRHIALDVRTLSDASMSLKEISCDMAGSARETAERFGSVASASEEMSANLTSIAAAIEETSATLNSVAAASEENTATSTEIVRSTDEASRISREAVKQAEGTSADMQALARAASDIDKVTETIAEISENVSLLALNATIEAARAGDAGKGFTVVANELKILATQTIEATKKIRKQIEHVQQTAAGTVTGIETISTTIVRVNEIISSTAGNIADQSSATHEININVAQGSLAIQEVTRNVAHCSTASNEISGDISGANKDAAKISENSLRLNNSAEDLSHLAEKLRQIVGQFQV